MSVFWINLYNGEKHESRLFNHVAENVWISAESGQKIYKNCLSCNKDRFPTEDKDDWSKNGLSWGGSCWFCDECRIEYTEECSIFGNCYLDVPRGVSCVGHQTSTRV
jgi:hypothetical protein